MGNWGIGSKEAEEGIWYLDFVCGTYVHVCSTVTCSLSGGCGLAGYLRSRATQKDRGGCDGCEQSLQLEA